MGTIVDVIRYPYRTTMRFYTDSAIETPVCWYFCSPEAKPLGCYTRFGSGLYGKDYMDRWDGTGETPFGPLDFRANCCNYPGKARIGTAQQFAEGVSIDDAPPAVRGLVNCSNPPQTLISVQAPTWMDVANEKNVDQTDAYIWAVYSAPAPGYILPNVLVTMTCDNDPGLNGSFTVSWAVAPDNIIIYEYPGAANFPFCAATPSTIGIQLLRPPGDGTFVDVLFSGTTIVDCELLRVSGTPRPASYSGSGFIPPFGNVTITISALPPLVPPPLAP